MRTLIAIVAGAILAVGASVGVVQVATNAEPEPVTKPLHVYGAR